METWDESIGSIITYGSDYTESDYTYPILFLMNFRDRASPFITEVDFEYVPHICCIHPKKYVLLQEGLHGLCVFRKRSGTWL